MNKKILVIEDEDKFIDELYNHLPIVGDPLPAERERLRAFFKGYEKDVIGFEAEVDFHQHIPAMELPQTFEPTEKVQVFVLKPKKPEGK